MNTKTSKKALCQITKKELPLKSLMPVISIRDPILELIKKDFPDLDTSGYISIDELKKYRSFYVRSILEEEKGELTKLEQEVIDSIKSSEILSKNVNIEFDEKLKFGERMADRLASIGGSWGFIIAFFILILLWIALNSLILLNKTFDPYPYIFLNLVLSCIAAIQAPAIMMSQNRQEQKDRLRAQNDYQVNLKAELEIRQLHEKIDHLLIHQGERLLEIQQVQMDFLNDILENLKNKK
jgi:uncharacterized membrane protein